jgi:hypothetical protein
MAMPNEFRDRVLSKLHQRGVRAECELCGTDDWALVDSPVTVAIANASGDVLPPYPTIPSAGLICNNCGNMRLLALGALDLFPDAAASEQPAEVS